MLCGVQSILPDIIISEATYQDYWQKFAAVKPEDIYDDEGMIVASLIEPVYWGNSVTLAAFAEIYNQGVLVLLADSAQEFKAESDQPALVLTLVGNHYNATKLSVKSKVRDMAETNPMIPDLEIESPIVTEEADADAKAAAAKAKSDAAAAAKVKADAAAAAKVKADAAAAAKVKADAAAR